MNFYPTFFITSATLDGDKVVLGVAGSPSLTPKSAVRFIFAPNLAVPSADGDAQVRLSVNGQEYPLYDKFSDPMSLSEIPTQCGMLRTRFPIVCGVGGGDSASSPFFIAWNLPQPAEYVIPL